ncbi:transporter, major facilitator family protein [Toxoplasma gondii ME49]|uniref:Membrane transporter PFB0275w n=2 Tax=Toxoplasma gondii TaxID=5811 RepID=B6KHA7_TOXGV|nr:transporter, major facilitator family protein [Toxoplasma gondii ME49]EPT25050.1 transporter, major facilitator family protein [Toxoplasma gondii ME49]ESS34243.1 transporter, major facilitator family protein [Toxoplasma gondii VEG]CEL78507.1 TPA: membrane transporter PFB0275w [Toxoplasma gondii VEG]|eukprot:XP_002367230.1 transporter, major facilitator family protein [Toxoplasma gondii ME49]
MERLPPSISASTRSSSPPASTVGVSRLSPDKRRMFNPRIDLPPVDPSDVSSLSSVSSFASPPRPVGRSLLPSSPANPNLTLFDDADDFSDSDEALPSSLPSRLTRPRCVSRCTYSARALSEMVLPPVTASPGASRFVLCTFFYSFLHGATDQLLPAAYKALEAQLHFSPTVLGSASSLARLAHAFCCPLWGVAVDALSGPAFGRGDARLSASRTAPAFADPDASDGRDGTELILRVSCVGWGVCTLLLALLTHEWQLMPLMLASGVLMAVLGPVSQKILGELVSSEKRGTAFGNMSFFQSTGRMLAVMLTTGLSAMVFSGVAGWRVSFAFVGCLSVAFGIALSWLLSPSPSSSLSSSTSPSRSASLSSSPACLPKTVCGAEGCMQKAKRHAAALLSLGYVFRTPSFGVMLLLGVLNGMPRSALNFIVMFFQYCGLADWQASFTVSASWIAAMLVAPVVGRLGDKVHRLYPNKGRPVLAQLAILTRALLMFLVLSVVPKRASSFPLFLGLSTLIGFMAGWPGVGVNRPVLTEIVLPRHRATVFSLFSTMESIGSALLGAPVVGMLAQQAFGYTKPLRKHRSSSSSSPSSSPALLSLSSSSSPPPSVFSDGGAQGDSAFPPNPSEEEVNAEALGKALLCTTVGPWIASVFVYFLLHWTYTTDRVAANRRKEIEEREAEREAAARAPDSAVELGCLDARREGAEAGGAFTKWPDEAEEKQLGKTRGGYSVVATREMPSEEGSRWDTDEEDGETGGGGGQA